jgi:hypothetical protein
MAATAASLALAAVTAGCGTGNGHPTTAPRRTTVVTATTQDAVQLRSQLEMLLGDHVLLTVELMRDLLGRGPQPQAQAAVDAVGNNTDGLSTAMTGLFGSSAGATFNELWAAHIRELADYARAVASADAAGRQTARADLQRTESDLGSLLASAAQLPAAAAQDAVAMHVQMLLEQADDYARGDYGASYRVESQALDHMVTLADTLAAAIAKVKGLSGSLTTPRRQLQSALARLFAAHMGIVVEAMRAAVDRSPDFSAAGATLNTNTTALGAAIGALYGHSAADAFLTLWAEHVDALVSYADATARHDGAAQAAAQRSLDDFATRLATFLATATQQRLPAVQLTGALTEHDRQLTDATDAYAAKDYAKAQDVAATGYAHMFMLAETLADAVGDVVAARLPHGGPQTGGGWAARERAAHGR